MAPGNRLINILNPDGTLNENAGPYKGLTIPMKAYCTRWATHWLKGSIIWWTKVATSALLLAYLLCEVPDDQR